MMKTSLHQVRIYYVRVNSSVRDVLMQLFIEVEVEMVLGKENKLKWREVSRRILLSGVSEIKFPLEVL